MPFPPPLGEEDVILPNSNELAGVVRNTAKNKKKAPADEACRGVIRTVALVEMIPCSPHTAGGNPHPSRIVTPA